MAFPKADKLEHVIQKATELGAAEIIAFPSQRCVSKPDPKSLEKKLERWQKIASSAAEQSGRGQIPRVRVLSSFAEAVNLAAEAELATLLYENEENFSLRSALSGASFKTVALMTGPEGGFTEDEVAAAKKAGLSICTLGPRILRCETAPLCALTAVLFACGELD
jgi:16S rRNA (uracil1498-N3)-methyltransferase